MTEIPEKELPIIYGFTDGPTHIGVQAYAIDGKTGEVVAQHFCSSEGFAKSDLGFSEPLFKYQPFSTTEEHSTVQFNNERHKIYQEKYPDGYKLVWMGAWYQSDIGKELFEKNQQKAN